jgi:hypothetical protein
MPQSRNVQNVTTISRVTTRTRPAPVVEPPVVQGSDVTKKLLEVDFGRLRFPSEILEVGNELKDILAFNSGAFDSIEEKYTALGGARGFLGEPMSDQETIKGGKRRVYRNGHIYWSAATGAWSVQGAILARYLAMGGPTGLLGFPTTDEMNAARPGSKASRFQFGGIWWSAKTGAKEVRGAILVKYLALGGDASFLGLPITNEVNQATGGRRSSFQGGVILWHSSTGAFEVHGAILSRYNSLGGTNSFLGFPLSDETDVKGLGGLAGKLSRFSGGTIYWSPQTGAYEVHGSIRGRYEAIGGPTSALGYPTSNETVVSPQDVRYNAFQNGVIAWKSSLGAVAICDLELRIGQVASGPIDDGIGDSSAELITYTTIRVDGKAIETNVRRPKGHAGTSYNINRRHTIAKLKPSTRIEFDVKVDDYDQLSGNDYLGTFRRSLDISTIWGLASSNQGVFRNVPLTQKSSDVPRLSSITLEFAIRTTKPNPLDPSKAFREQFWWNSGNPKTPKLSKQQYANTFRDVGHRTNWFETAVHPWDSLFYLAYEGLAAKGNCFGMSLEGALSLTGRSIYSQPIHRFAVNSGVISAFNLRHGYQVGDASIRWILWKLGTLDAIRPKRVYQNIKSALNRGDWPLLSMFNLKNFSGHTVLAYECPPVASGKPLIVRVADPNHPFKAGSPHPTYIEIDQAADTFKFRTPNGVSYQSAKIGSVLPATLMMETPVSLLAGQPRTPFWEFAALLATLGGLVILAGEAEVEQLTADGRELFKTVGGMRTFEAGGANGWMRVPVVDHADTRIPAILAQSGRPSIRLELALRGRGNGTYRQYFRGARQAVVVNAPIQSGKTDTLRMVRMGTIPTRVEVDTTGSARLATLGISSVLDPQRGVFSSASARIGIAAGETAFMQSSADGVGVVIRSAGAARPLDVEFERSVGKQLRRVTLTVPAGAASESLIIKPADSLSPLGEMLVSRFTAGGSPTGLPVQKIQPRSLDARAPRVVDPDERP